MRFFHQYFWKKKHKYYIIGGAIYGKLEVKSMSEEDWEEED
jgi:hypothetical protein